MESDIAARGARPPIAKQSLPARERLAGLGAAAAVFFACIYFFPYFPALGSPNELTRLYLTRAIVEDGSFSLDGPVARHGRITDLAHHGGRLYSDKAPGTGLLGVPVYLLVLGAAGGDPANVSNETLLRALRIALAALPTAAAVWLLFGLLASWGISLRARLSLSLGYGLGTAALPYGSLLFGHQLCAFFLLAALVALRRRGAESRPGRDALAGALLGLAVLAEYPAIMMALPLALGALAASPRRWKTLSYGLMGAAIPAAVLVAYHLQCFGGPLQPGYGHLLHAPFAEVHSRGLFGLGAPSISNLLASLFSPTRGLLFFSPWLALGLWAVFARVRAGGAWGRPLAVAIVAGCALYLLLSAALDPVAWGWSMSARHLCPCIPFLVLSLGDLLRSPTRAARLSERALPVLLPLSLLAHALPLATFGGFPPDFSNPLADFSVRLLSAGCLSPSLGSRAGLGFFAAVLPMALLVGGIGLGLLLAGPARAWAKAARAGVFAALLGMLLFWRGPTDPREERALDWARREVLQCDAARAAGPAAGNGARDSRALTVAGRSVRKCLHCARREERARADAEPLAQTVEHQTFNLRAMGSNPMRLMEERTRMSPHRLARSGHRPFTPATGVRIPLGT